MNQILMTNDKNSAASKHEVKPIVKFFAIAIILIALIIGGQAIYNLCSNRNDNYPKPTLTFNKNGSSIGLIMKSEIGINKIEYFWNDGQPTLVKGNGKRDLELDIEIPQGNNTLNVSIIDVEGNKTKYSKVDVALDASVDTIKPVISIVNSVGKINLNVTDNSALDYITYQWEGEDEIKVVAETDNQTSISQEVNVIKGTKKLTITAYDKSGNKETITKTVVGSNGATIKVTSSDGKLNVKVSAELGITKILYTYNEEQFAIEDIQEGSTEYEFKLDLKQGVNYLLVNAYEGDLMTEYKCKKTVQ